MTTKALPAKVDQLTHPVTPLALSKLHFDLSNPRYGPRARKFKDETEVVDEIAGTFGLEDLLSSMAVNGYFASEPLVGLKDPKLGGIRIMEGNRRLAACLILAGDPRAKRQDKRRQRYLPLWKQHDSKQIEPVPVMVFDGQSAKRQLLPYLGVRHIVGAQPWDSYAKAAWVARVVENGSLTLDDIIQMIGDDQRTSERILSAYYLVGQLQSAGRFDPNDSVRRGKGSQAEFPFSLVYNAIDRPQVREWIGLPEGKRALAPHPIKGDLDNAGSLLLFICGSQRQDIAPAIKDSRQISRLAQALSDPVLAMALKRGASLDEVEQEAKPPKERLLDGLSTVRSILEDLLGVVGRESLRPAEASELLKLSQNVKALASNVAEHLVKAAISDGKPNN